MSGKKNLANKVLILGASSDIGIEVVKLFLKNNANKTQDKKSKSN